MNFENLKKFDPEVYETLKTELERQRTNIELIASENIVSEAVMEAVAKSEEKKQDTRVVLLLEGKLPDKLVSLKNMLGVEVVDGVLGEDIVAHA